MKDLGTYLIYLKGCDLLLDEVVHQWHFRWWAQTAAVPVSQGISPAISATDTRILATVSHPDTGLGCIQRLVLFSSTRAPMQIWRGIKSERRERWEQRKKLPVSASLPSCLGLFGVFQFTLAGNRRKHGQLNRRGFMLCARLLRNTEPERRGRYRRV